MQFKNYIRALVLSGCCVSLLTACNSIEHRSEEITKKPLPELTKKVAAPNLQWSNNIGKGSSTIDAKLQLALTNDAVIAANTAGEIRALSRSSGKTLWRQQAKMLISAGPSVVGNHVFVGTRDGSVLAYRLQDGKFEWKTAVTGEVLASPEGAGDAVYVNTLDGSLTALSIKDGSQQWRYSLGIPPIVLRQGSEPIVTRNHILAGFANGRLVALHRHDGALDWEREISIPTGRSDIQRMSDVSSPPVVKEGMVYTVGYQGRLVALSLESGNSIWEKELSSYSGVTLAHNTLFISDAKGVVWSVDRKNGKTLWEQTALQGRRLSKPTVVNNMIVVGDEEGFLHFLSLQDGRLLNRIKVDGKGVDAAPLWDKNKLYVLGRSGKIAVYSGLGLGAAH